MDQIKAQIEQTTSDYDKEKLQERLAKLAGGVAVIKVGAATETELKEKKHRVEDALSATRAAVEEGIVPGGGVALLNALPALDDAGGRRATSTTGVNILRRALEEPMRQIAANAGQDGSVVVETVRRIAQEQKNTGIGYDVLTERVRRHGGPGHHRPGQGHPLGGGECGVHRRHDPDHRGADHRHPGGEACAGSGGGGMPAAWAAWTTRRCARRPAPGRLPRLHDKNP